MYCLIRFLILFIRQINLKNQANPQRDYLIFTNINDMKKLLLLLPGLKIKPMLWWISSMCYKVSNLRKILLSFIIQKPDVQGYLHLWMKHKINLFSFPIIVYPNVAWFLIFETFCLGRSKTYLHQTFTECVSNQYAHFDVSICQM